MRLIERAAGVGPKQASMFLRNIGFCFDLAVIDIHVLRFLSLEFDSTLDASSIASLRRYEILEERFRELAIRYATVPAYLDTAAWVVMRTLSSNGAEWA
jgi:N-glycosylase/DNA lyase